MLTKKAFLMRFQTGAHLLAAETLLHPLEAQAILAAAAQEHAETVMISFAARADGTLFSGHDAADVLPALQDAGAAAVGINCIAASDALPGFIARLREHVDIPLLCKPNAGRAVNGTYPVDERKFAQVMKKCAAAGAALLGGCCGTTPAYIQALSLELQ